MSADSFLADILAQPETIARLCRAYMGGDLAHTLAHAADAIRAAQPPVCLTGMGASYFALVAAKAFLDRRGVQSNLEDTSYLVEYGRASIHPGQAVVLVSQSGRTGEAVELMEMLKDHRPLVVVTNDPQTELARRADFLLPLLAVPDSDGVALKTYTGSLTLLLMLAAEITDRASSALGAVLARVDRMTKAIAVSQSFLDRMVEFSHGRACISLLGRGPSIASALGGALLFKETAKLPAEGANAGQFRHGAMEIISEGALVVMFSPHGSASGLNLQLADDLQRAGARVLFVGPQRGSSTTARFVIEIEVPNEFLAPVFEILPLQLLTRELALRRGIRPGTFVNTTPVVLTR